MPSAKLTPQPEQMGDFPYALVFDLSLVPTLITFHKSHIVHYVNPSFCTLIKKSAEEMTGVPLAVSACLTEKCHTVFSTVYKSGKPVAFTEPQLCDTLSICGGCSISPLFDNSNGVYGVILQVLELPERILTRTNAVEVNQELLLNALRQHDAEATLNLLLNKEVVEREQSVKDLAVSREILHEAQIANTAKNIFLANISHEMRTPLTTIIGYAEMIKDDVETSKFDTVAADLDIIRHSGEHLLQIINDILDVAKMESGKMELNVNDFNADEMISSLVYQAKPLVDKNGNKLTVSVAKKLGTLHSDEIKVRQILLNLLSNSAKFTRKGTVTLEAAMENSGNNVIFRVSDTGVGISNDELGNIFFSFYQVKQPRNAELIKGTGLGLTLCKQFCEMLGGNISVTSVPGEGSTFEVTLPVTCSRS